MILIAKIDDTQYGVIVNRAPKGEKIKIEDCDAIVSKTELYYSVISHGIDMKNILLHASMEQDYENHDILDTREAFQDDLKEFAKKTISYCTRYINK